MSGVVEVAGPGIVAQSLPALKHLFFGSSGQIFYGWEAFQKTMIIGEPLLYTGLL